MAVIPGLPRDPCGHAHKGFRQINSRGRRLLATMSHGFCAGMQTLHVTLDVVKGLTVNHRPHIGGQFGAVAHRQLLHSALDHFNHLVGNALVHTQQAQRRAALPGGTKGALHHGIDHLLGQRAAVHQHGVDAAGLGNQGGDGTVFGGQGAVDDFGDLGRTGKHHTGDARRGHQRRAHGFTRAVQQLQHPLGHTGCMQQPHGGLGHARRLLGGFGQHGVAGGQRCGHLADKNGQRKIPGADADPDAARTQAQGVGFARDAMCHALALAG